MEGRWREEFVFGTNDVERSSLLFRRRANRVGRGGGQAVLNQLPYNPAKIA